MTGFQAQRVIHQYTQHNDAPPEKVFPLLCPVREAEWVPGWQYRLIYSKTGFAEAGCVFATPNDDGSESIWVVSHYDPPAFRVAFVWVQPGMVATEIRISLARNPTGNTDALIGYTYTGLSPAGNAEVTRFTEEWFRQKMRSWEVAINHYLRTGKLIPAAAWE